VLVGKAEQLTGVIELCNFDSNRSLSYICHLKFCHQLYPDFSSWWFYF